MTLPEIRRQAICLVKSGMKAKEVADELEVSRKSVQEWGKVYKDGGMKALRARKQGRPMGSGLRLSEEQQAKIRVIICETTPEQLKMPFALWTREGVESLIRDLFSIRMERRPLRGTGSSIHSQV
ncbi:MAG: helix-turn-helix domain-containing protein [Luteolibacter sp.]